MSTKAMRMCCWQSRSKIRSEQTAAGVRAATEVDGGQSKDKVNVMFLDGPNRHAPCMPFKRMFQIWLMLSTGQDM
jgi:hypothetical protein